MDLNLYLGPPRSPRTQSSNLGSDLALSSLPPSTSPPTEESRAPSEMSGAREPTDWHAPYSPSHASFTMEPTIPPPDAVDAGDGDFDQEYDPYSPSYEPYAPSLPESDSYIPLDPQEAIDAPLLVSPLRTVSPLMSPFVPPMLPPMFSPRGGGGEVVGRYDESSLRQELFESHASRLRRLIESSHRPQLRRSQPSRPHSGSERHDCERLRRSAAPFPAEQTTQGWTASPVPERQTVHDMMGSQRKVPAGGVETESLEEENEEKGNAAANFECNICFDMAKEPVVTSCGHLFCWPCLYQWLHVHSEHKECPVCKGEVTESNITPIYGRGSSDAADGKKLVETGESNVKIPPRPRGNRIESWMQQVRHFVDQRLGARNRVEGHGEPSMFNAASLLTRMRARRMLRDELNAEIGPEAEENRMPIDNTSTPQSSRLSPLLLDAFDIWNNPSSPTPLPLIEEGIDAWHRRIDSLSIPESGGAHRIFCDGIETWHQPRESMPVLQNGDTYQLCPHQADRWHRRVVGNGNRYGPSTSSVNPSGHAQVIPRSNVASASAADHVSASSATAAIHGDASLLEGSAEPNSAGSSRSFGRRGRGGASGSLDVDGVLHACKTRRLN